MLQAIRSYSRMFTGRIHRGNLLTRLFRLPVSEVADNGRGLILIQIDGLSYEQFSNGLARGKLPFLRRLLQREHYISRPLYSGLPATTPAVQAELFYGVKTTVPAFEFVDRNTAELKRMYQQDAASEVEAALQGTGAQGLLAGGSSYCNIFTGGAQESYFCASSLTVNSVLSTLNPINLSILFLTNLMSVLRLLALLPIELVIALWDFLRGVVDGRSFVRELKFIPVRVTVAILLRELCVIGAKIDISRGLPVIHMNLFGYDEQSHRRGPASLFAIWSLKGIDYAIKRVWRDAMRARRRHYDVWIYSDHGQSAMTTFDSLAGQPLSAAVEQAWSRVAVQAEIAQTAIAQADVPQPEIAQPEIAQPEIALPEIGKAAPARRQAAVNRAMTSATHTRHYAVRWFWPENIAQRDVASWIAEPSAGFQVAALGPVGFIYLDEPVADDVAQALAGELVGSHRVPVAIVRDAAGQLTAFTSQGQFSLPEQIENICGPDHPCLPMLRDDLCRLCQHRNAGDLTLLGWRQGLSPVTFALENGSHAGLSPQETCAFSLLPQHALGQQDALPKRDALSERNALPKQNARTLIRPADIRQAALALLGRLPATREMSRAVSRRQNEHGRIRVMTYNTHSCIGTDGQVAPERIARVISQFEPDVVALQELDAGRPRTQGHNQAEIIAATLEMQYYFHPVIHVEEERYGNAILTHLPERLVHTGILPQCNTRLSREPRGAQWIAVEFCGVQIQFFNTHLGLSARERQMQARALIGEDWLGHADAGGPRILCGDLNSLPNSQTWRILNGQLEDVQLNLQDHRPLGTFYSRLPGARIDHVFASNDFTVEAVLVPRSHLTRLASDHLPLIVDLRLREE